MAKQFSELSVIPERGSSFAEFSKSALREFNQRHSEVSLLDDDVWLKFDTVRVRHCKDKDGNEKTCLLTPHGKPYESDSERKTWIGQGSAR
jgi:hypothetical protein